MGGLRAIAEPSDDRKGDWAAQGFEIKQLVAGKPHLACLRINDEKPIMIICQCEFQTIIAVITCIDIDQDLIGIIMDIFHKGDAIIGA